jgi:hypothetical protein
MDKTTRETLDNLFAPHNEDLKQLLRENGFTRSFPVWLEGSGDAKTTKEDDAADAENDEVDD